MIGFAKKQQQINKVFRKTCCLGYIIKFTWKNDPNSPIHVHTIVDMYYFNTECILFKVICVILMFQVKKFENRFSNI